MNSQDMDAHNDILSRFAENIRRVFVGSPETVEMMLAALLANGHVLIEDVPGVVDVIWRIRPLALVAVEAELMRALEIAANKYLGDRVAQVLEHLHEPPAPNGSREPPASKS